jgi:Zn-dependent protease with chaperone function
LLVPWLSRHGEQAADRTAADLGYGRALVEVFAGREFERAQSAPGWQRERFSVGNSHPVETTRQRMLEKYLKRVAEGTHQPYRIDAA